MNVLKYHGIITGPMGRTGRDTDIFVANSGHIVLATHGGFVELLVNLNDKVQAGQKAYEEIWPREASSTFASRPCPRGLSHRRTDSEPIRIHRGDIRGAENGTPMLARRDIDATNAGIVEAALQFA